MRTLITKAIAIAITNNYSYNVVILNNYKEISYFIIQFSNPPVIKCFLKDSNFYLF